MHKTSNKSPDYYVEGKKSERLHIVWCHLYNNPEKINCLNRKQITDFWWSEWVGRIQKGVSAIKQALGDPCGDEWLCSLTVQCQYLSHDIMIKFFKILLSTCGGVDWEQVNGISLLFLANASASTIFSK